MPFSDKEIEQMRTILNRLMVGVPTPIQYHLPEGLTRVGFTFGARDKKGKYILIYQNYPKLSNYRLKLLNKLAKKINYKLNITNPTDDLTCVGWKFEEKNNNNAKSL